MAIARRFVLTNASHANNASSSSWCIIRRWSTQSHLSVYHTCGWLFTSAYTAAAVQTQGRQTPRTNPLGYNPLFIKVGPFYLVPPIFPGPLLDKTWSDRCADLSRAVYRLSLVGSQDAVMLLRASFRAPRVQHLLRCSPSADHATLGTFDDWLRSALSRITNSDLTDTQWPQASLRLKDGGWGETCRLINTNWGWKRLRLQSSGNILRVTAMSYS